MEFVRQIGHFDLLRPLGRGGMGEVWLARDRRLGRQVALKLLPEEVGQDPRRRQLFEKEAPHLLQLAQTTEAELFLLEWVWDGEGWIQSEPLELSADSVGADSLSAVYMENGRLGVIYGTLIDDATTGSLEDNLFYTSRELVGEATDATPLPTLTPTPLPTATATPDPGPTLEPTVQLPQVENGAVDEESSGLVAGILSALVVVGGVFGVGYWTRRKK